MMTEWKSKRVDDTYEWLEQFYVCTQQATHFNQRIWDENTKQSCQTDLTLDHKNYPHV